VLGAVQGVGAVVAGVVITAVIRRTGELRPVAVAFAAMARGAVLATTSSLVLVAADPSAYRELGRLQVCGNTWSFPAYSGGRLYVRDGRFLYCYALAAGS